MRKRTWSSISHSLNVRQVHACFKGLGAIDLVVWCRFVVDVKVEFDYATGSLGGATASWERYGR
jgi:hypothetical protein